MRQFWRGVIQPEADPPWAEIGSMWYVYILFSDSLKKRYIGLTQNLRLRFAEHNHGVSNFTKRGTPWKLIYYETFLNKSDASQEEKFLKSGKGRERLGYLLKKTMSQMIDTGEV